MPDSISDSEYTLLMMSKRRGLPLLAKFANRCAPPPVKKPPPDAPNSPEVSAEPCGQPHAETGCAHSAQRPGLQGQIC